MNGEFFGDFELTTDHKEHSIGRLSFLVKYLLAEVGALNEELGQLSDRSALEKTEKLDRPEKIKLFSLYSILARYHCPMKLVSIQGHKIAASQTDCVQRTWTSLLDLSLLSECSKNVHSCTLTLFKFT